MFDFPSANRGQYPFDYERHRAIQAFGNHRMTIENDDGVFRSLFFRNPESSCYHFRLNTWPGHLAITGDMGSYVFSRTYDMFDFFAHSNDPAAMPLEINASYWAEKLEATDRRSDLMPDNVDVDYVKREVVEAFRSIDPSAFRTGERLDAFRHLRYELLNELHEDCDSSHVRSQLEDLAIPSYYLAHNSYEDLQFLTDVWEMPIAKREYGFTYLLTCYAIVWGIKRYTQIKQGRDTDSRFRAIHNPEAPQ